MHNIQSYYTIIITKCSLYTIPHFQSCHATQLGLNLDGSGMHVLSNTRTFTPFFSTAGFVSIDFLRFSLTSALTADPPVFTLTCVSTGGPATTVTWTRNGAAATGVTSQTVTGMLTATYVNTLTVTGRLPGNYQCSVTNGRSTAVHAMRVKGVHLSINIPFM